MGIIENGQSKEISKREAQESNKRKQQLGEKEPDDEIKRGGMTRDNTLTMGRRQNKDQQSTINDQRSTINDQRSTINDEEEEEEEEEGRSFIWLKQKKHDVGTTRNAKQ
eukprot:scaffold77056_cov71-Attheya_sp.AAC.3